MIAPVMRPAVLAILVASSFSSTYASAIPAACPAPLSSSNPSNPSAGYGPVLNSNTNYGPPYVQPFDWGQAIIRGVNLGGWLVLEPWITPSIFEAYPAGNVVDEYTLGQYDPVNAPAILKKHWDTWVTLQDFKTIANYGFNIVRIPIGYWAYNLYGEPFITGAAPYLDLAIDWANQTGLKVVVDLHGAPLSQNGFDNSGQRLPSGTPPGWGTGDSVSETLAVIKQISDKYASSQYSGVVAGIELLNEPLASTIGVNTVKEYEQAGYSQVRTSANGAAQPVVVIQDGFLNPNSYNGWLTPSDGAQGVAIDHHEYQVFSPSDVALTPAQHRQAVCQRASGYEGADKWTFVGEWTAAMTDCAPFLNGYGTGARYDGTFPGSSYVGSCADISNIDTWSDQLKSDTRGYIEAQMEVFEQTTRGWFFWNFKTENAAEWDMYRLVNAGVFPQPLTSRNFSMICSSIT